LACVLEATITQVYFHLLLLLLFFLKILEQHHNLSIFLLLTGDPAIIGVACSIVADITAGKFNLLKWDKQERKYYPIEINLHEKGEIDE